MRTDLPTEQECFRIAVASILRHSVNPGVWIYTVVGKLHTKLESVLRLAPEEMVITSTFISEASWYAFTTRRIVSQFNGEHLEIDPRLGITDDVGNLKGIGPKREAGEFPTTVGSVTSDHNGVCLRFEYETVNASMAPVYACMFWSRAKRFTSQASSS